MEDEKMCGVCYICGEPLVWDENSDNCFVNDFDDDYMVKEIRCEHCGTLYQYYINEDNKTDSDEDYVQCSYQGFGNCAHCGGNNVWSGDFMRSDYENDYENNELLDENDDAIVRSLVCGHCGCSIEVWEPTPNEMRSGKYPFWEDNKYWNDNGNKEE